MFRLIGVLLVTLGFAILPQFLGSFHTFVATQMVIFAIFAVSFNMAFGFAGLASLGHAAFFGLGSYTLAIGMVRYDAPFWLAFTLGPLAGLVAGTVFGVICWRARGLYFLLLTLALAQSIWGLAVKLVDFTGGDQGLGGFTRPDVLGWTLWDTDTFFYFCLVWFLVSMLVMLLVLQSPFGLALRGLRESESRLIALGYQVNLIRVIVLAVSGLFSGLAGVLLALNNTYVDPSSLYWLRSADVMLMALVGGVGTFLGPVFGAAGIIALENWISGYTERWLLILGMVYMVTVLFARHGLAGFVAQGWVLMRGWPIARELAALPAHARLHTRILAALAWRRRRPLKTKPTSEDSR